MSKIVNVSRGTYRIRLVTFNILFIVNKSLKGPKPSTVCVCPKPDLSQSSAPYSPLLSIINTSMSHTGAMSDMFLYSCIVTCLKYIRSLMICSNLKFLMCNRLCLIVTCTPVGAFRISTVRLTHCVLPNLKTTG